MRSLGHNRIRDVGAAAIADALKTNATLIILECVEWERAGHSRCLTTVAHTACPLTDSRLQPLLRLAKRSRRIASCMRYSAWKTGGWERQHALDDAGKNNNGGAKLVF